MWIIFYCEWNVTRFRLILLQKLDSVQLSSLLSHRSSSIPLWLSIACEELRVFGDFATVSSKIKNFPDELNELMKDVIQRLIREDETQALQKVIISGHIVWIEILGNLATVNNYAI